MAIADVSYHRTVNGMIQVGIVGLGFMGMIHYLTYRKLPGVRVAAICEVNEQRLAGDWTDIKGNFGPAGEQMDLSGVATLRRLDEMLATAELDLVDVTLPPALHADATVAALAAGKHVFCEKPMSLRLAECERMVGRGASRPIERLFVGHVLPFFPEYAWAYEAVRSGRYGTLRGGAFRRVISDPAWLRNFWTPTQVGGPMLDLHVHDAHFIRLLFGMPDEVVSRGRLRDEAARILAHAIPLLRDSDYVVEATSRHDRPARPRVQPRLRNPPRTGDAAVRVRRHRRRGPLPLPARRCSTNRRQRRRRRTRRGRSRWTPSRPSCANVTDACAKIRKAKS